MEAIRYAAATLLCAFAISIAMPASAQEPLLNVIFQDHAVLQRDKPIHVWGSASPGAKITVSIAQTSAQAQADSTGHWEATLPAMQAGGPYTLAAGTDTGASEKVNDVLVGDVWLCSGQSNMVLAQKYTLDASVASPATDNTLRLMTVDANTSAAPLAAFPATVKWQVASPTTVPDFSGACYYFGHDLQRTEHVPMGLVVSAWNGANITTFMSDAALRKIGGYDGGLDALKLYAADTKAGIEHWGNVLEGWWREHQKLQVGAEPWNPASNVVDWQTAPAGLGDWMSWGLPALAHFTGNVWFRTTVTLTAAQAAQDAELSLGNLNEEDETWVNGTFIGDTFGYGTARLYKLPAGTLHKGENHIAVNILCTYRGCGLLGPAENRSIRFKDGTAAALGTAWRYQIVPTTVGQAPRAPWGAVAGLGMVYNAMIAPLTPYAFRGVAWYQGESNTGGPNEYRDLLSGMMTDWRTKFGSDLPFLIVQLPDYGPAPVKPEASSWAELRDAQRAAVTADTNAALAVTIDIGAHYGLHPANKEEVGRRLALAARRLVYKETSVATGPTAVRAIRHLNSVIVSFANIDNGLVAYDASEPIGFELCGPIQASCRYATARIHADAVWLAIPTKFSPTHVRYCWADGPICTLFDGARLPAGPFDLPIEQSRTTKMPQHHARPRKSRARSL